MQLNKKIVFTVRRRLFAWYKKNGRTLPWRETRDPYKILVSEIMLQQTQVDRVIEKYHEFLSAFPTAEDLAKAKTSAVIKVWKGLGYNRRALFLQRTAQAVVNEHSGVFPQELEELKKLPGVGDYTARAIMSFAFELPVPMMDTNHRRFYQRIFVGLEEKKDAALLEIAEDVIAKRCAYDWNQALMDFGSVVCMTKSPKCEECPMRNVCALYPDVVNGKWEAATQKKKKSKKKIPFKQTDRYFRGRIMDALREKHKIGKGTLRKRFAEIDDARFEKVVAGLVKDHLVVVKGRNVCLPE